MVLNEIIMMVMSADLQHPCWKEGRWMWQLLTRYDAQNDHIAHNSMKTGW